MVQFQQFAFYYLIDDWFSYEWKPLISVLKTYPISTVWAGSILSIIIYCDCYVWIW